MMKMHFRVPVIFLTLLCASNIPGSGVLRVNATSHVGDIDVGGEDIFVIEGSFQQEGSIHVRENGTLILNGATLEIIQHEGSSYGVDISENGTLEVSNSHISSALRTPIYLFDSAVAKIETSTFDGIGPIKAIGQSLVSVSGSQLDGEIYLYNSSNVAVFDSRVYEFFPSDFSMLSLYRSSSTAISAQDRAVITATNSSVTLFWIGDMATARARNSTISSLNPSGDSNVYLNGSSINSISVGAQANVFLSDQSKVQFLQLAIDDSVLYLSGVEEGYSRYASMGSEPDGWKVLVDMSTINSIILHVTGKSSLIISNSTLGYVNLFSFSTATIIDSQIHWLNSNDNTITVLLNSQIYYIDRKGEAKIIELSGYMAPYVFYQTLALMMVSVIILMLIPFIFLWRKKNQRAKLK